MNEVPAETEQVVEESGGARPRRRLRFELIFGSILLAGGLFALPAAIFAVGSRVLGSYADDRGLGRFYADFFGDLAEPSVRAWAIALGPLVLITLIRLVFLRTPPQRTRESEPAATQNQEEPPEPAHRRIEPRVGVE
jgi:hypothetical protein